MKYVWTGIVIVVIVFIVWVFGTKPSAPEPQIQQEPQTEPVQATQPITNNKPQSVTSMDIKVTKEGAGEVIKAGQTAVVSYTGKLTDGTVFDSNVDPAFGHVQPFAFSLGAGQVIKGWDQGVEGMKVGETRVLTIPSDLAYGASGIPGVIPGGATLVFEVTLNAIK